MGLCIHNRLVVGIQVHTKITTQRFGDGEKKSRMILQQEWLGAIRIIKPSITHRL